MTDQIAQLRIWDLLFFVGFLIYVAIRGVFDRRAGKVPARINRRDTLEFALLVMVGVGSLGLPLLYLFTPWLAFADYPLPVLAPWIGAALMPAALWLFYRAHADLGVNWSVTLEIREGHRLVRDGVYRHLRHPMYAAILLFDVAQGLLLANWLAGWAALATFLLLYVVRVPREERLMEEVFAEEYRDYARCTGRLFPGLGKPRLG
jgi:protein-S-isoprenylcysteine O-methyltransferase Ste14